MAAAAAVAAGGKHLHGPRLEAAETKHRVRAHDLQYGMHVTAEHVVHDIPVGRSPLPLVRTRTQSRKKSRTHSATGAFAIYNTRVR
jgi:hypothetical protein